ncbi:hypothetical protein D9615_001654 [Tricholomella constricta]|uniref:Piwi-domain-containing protein n=1 Tax=Tricholomella constricta TaxID=117010 RepID=A0A8H5MAS8_9AGAR|nr:hypothetical protein D9615_001654 [Tricholomella constricta]
MSRYQVHDRAVKVTTNSFEITKLPVKEYTQYDIITPEVKIPRKRQEIIHKLQTVIAPNIFSPRAVYDGKAIMYASKPLQLPGGGAGSFTVCLTATLPTSATPQARGSFEVKITNTIGEVIKTSDMNRLIKGRQADNQTTVATNLLQLLIRQDSNQKYANNGRAYFTPHGSRAIGSGLELWRGFFQSVRPTIGRMLVNIDTSVSAVYAAGELVNVCLDFLGRKDVRDLSMDGKHPSFRALEKHLENVLINTRTTGKRTKSIKGLVPYAGRFEFSRDEKDTTVQEYYKDAYNMTLKFPNIIGVRLSGKKATFPVVVPAELCTILPGQLYTKRLPDHLTKVMVDFATIKPNDRLRQIESGETGLESPVNGYAKSEFLVEAGMVIETRPITIKGKLLDTPNLWYGEKRQVKPRDGAWNLKGQKLQNPRPMSCWAVINFCPATLRINQCENYMKSLAESCRILGMNTGRPIAIISGIGNAVEKALNEVLQKALQENFKREELMVIAVLPAKAPAIRVRIKHWGDITQGVLTQCLCEDKVKRANEQYWGNVGLKLNARFGGYNSLTQSKVLDELRKEPFMIMGADVGHPGPGIMKPSVTSLVWSYDEYATRYATCTGVQYPRVEVIDKLQDMVKRAIIAFGMRNRASPRRIVFYRDGVSEGEFDNTLKMELGAMKAAFDDVWREKNLTGPKPTVTFIVVGKRHHVIFFPQDDSTRDRTGNCRAGFVADEGVSHPVTLDFYLQSHAAVKGTSRSSHYSVLADENFQNNVVKLQELSFALCHVYAKATRSVSIPAPIYYADLVCSRGDIHFDPDSNLRFADDVTTSSDSSTFNMARWEKGFLPINEKFDKTMYFL